MELVHDNGIRELDRRSSHGLEVALLWDPHSDRVFVEVTDERTAERLQLQVDAARALDAFHHPYAYDRRAAA
jgi:hypothetical protein